MRTYKQHCRGFTLIELMIVVAILAILATVAIVAYGQYAQKAKNSEATSVLADIRIKQEAYRASFHQYAGMQIGTLWMPDSTPGADARAWPVAGTINTLPGAWRMLGVTPDHGVYFSYTCMAGAPGDAAGAPFGGLDIENQNDFWFAAQALQDLNEDGDCGGFEIYSGQGKIVDLDEGEVGCP